MVENNHIGSRIRILSNNIRLAIDRKLNSLGLTGQQSFVLRYLSMHDGEVVYPKDIEKRFNLTHPTVSGLLQRLEAKGFITCIPDPDDRRYKRVAITPSAREIQAEFIRLLDMAAENIIAENQKEESDL